jgi:Uma2 family endonuclease
MVDPYWSIKTMNVRLDYSTLTAEEFFAWIHGQEARYELVDSEVVMVPGAGRRHNAIVINLIAAVRPQTRGERCQTFTGATYVATATSTRRMPDMGVDCGEPDQDSLMADKPSLVAEVLSPTTGGFDLMVKLAEYQNLPSLDFILFVDTESPVVHLYRRDADRRWQSVVIKGLDAMVELEKLKISVPLRDIYEGVQFRPKQKLVQSSQGDAEPNGRSN